LTPVDAGAEGLRLTEFTRGASKLEIWPIGRLTASRRNSRTHPLEQIDALCESIDRFGLDNPILIDATGEIIAGGARWRAALRLNHEQVLVIVLGHLDMLERRADLLADNKRFPNAAAGTSSC
jgi:ParB-like chromosome segregation protein Spo0J